MRTDCTPSASFRSPLRGAMLLLLTACATGCPGPSERSGADAAGLFVAANAWDGPVPAEAGQVDAATFERGIASGDLVWDGPAARTRQAQEARAAYADALAYLKSIPAPSPVLARLIADADAASGDTVFADVDHRLADGRTVRLLGLAERVRRMAEAQRRIRDPANALDTYRLVHALLPVDRRDGLPAPDALAGEGLEAIRDALQQLDTRTGTLDRVDARPEAATPDPVALQMRSGPPPSPGTGTQAGDRTGTCTPVHFARRFWFPLKHFVSPIKDQGQRATCWAFAAMGALESRERVQHDRAPDFSEQFAVHRYKLSWARSDYDEGGGAEHLIDLADRHGQGFPTEGTWVYNRSGNRTQNDATRTYANSCTGYTGTCGETAHQSHRVCVTLGARSFCGFQTVGGVASVVQPGSTNLLWTAGDPFLLSLYRDILANGHVLIAGFELYPGIDAPNARGVVTDPGTASTRGGHIAQIVGFIGNDQLAAAQFTERGDGGGFFILKNSWGCWGDGGYAYVPVDYVRRNFSALSTLVFRNSPRSARWQAEQASPGSTEAPMIVVGNGPAADLRVPYDIERVFGVTHSTADSVQFRLVSDRQGVVYDGPLVTRSGGIRESLKVVFTLPGPHALTATARAGNWQSTATARVDVVNTAPEARLEAVEPAYTEQAHPFELVVRDRNEADTAALCAGAEWRAIGYNTRITGSGCTRSVTFAGTGKYQVQVTVRDREGLTALAVRNIAVLPPLANPYPRVTATAMRARQFVQGRLRFCGDVALPTGATIDLRQRGCRSLVGTGQQAPLKHVAKVTVENPSGERLTYDWAIYVTYNDGREHLLEESRGQTAESWAPGYGGNNAGGTVLPCRVQVKVNAPEAARSKVVRVWSGKCSYPSMYVG